MRFSFVLVAFLSLSFHLATHAISQDSRSTQQREGLRENRPNQFALTGVTAITAPGMKIEKAVILVRDGKIEAVRKRDFKVPANYRRIDLSGKTVYTGLIDAFSEIEIDSSQIESGAPYWNQNIRPQIQAAQHLVIDDSKNEPLRKLGITAILAVPKGGIFRGVSALVATAGENVQKSLVRGNIAQHAILTLRRRSFSTGNRPSYPNSPMGAVALARQAMYDATWYLEANRAANGNPLLPQPELNDSLKALEPVITGNQPIVIDSLNELYLLRAHRFATEFKLKAIIKGSGLEFRRLDEVASTGRPILLPVNFPTAPSVSSFESALNVSLETLMEWDHAPENPGRLANAGIEFAFCSDGLENKEDFLKNIRRAVKRGLSRQAALQALTVTPAKLFGVSDLMGKIERGMLANLVVTDGDLFDDETKILETWVAGNRYEHETSPVLELTGDWKIESLAPGKSPTKINYLAKIKSNVKSTTGTIQLANKKNPASQNPKKKNKRNHKKSKQSKSEEPKTEDVKFTKIGIKDSRVSAVFDATQLGGNGITRLTFVFSDSQDFAEGFVILADGNRIPASLSRLKKTGSAQDTDSVESKTKQASKKPKPKNGQESVESSNPGIAEKTSQSMKASFPVNFPLGASGHWKLPPVEQVLIKNVTIWTCADRGIIKNGSILLRQGKIVQVGSQLKVPTNRKLTVIDGKGMHVTPGIIDCHSHMASDGGINESGQAITAEVRIGDFINCDDINIYRQLAGGVTCSNILHGSANPIGGQNQVIKLRWGMVDEQMKFSEAPKGIKFALGENVKRSRDRESTRYPKTRMGVEQIFLDEFRAAKGYEQEWKRWNENQSGLPPRRNLELDAIVEILHQKRWIHCHSYRQDEILALIRLLDGFKIRIGTFQHILEGYKVADAMKKHGAMGSAFADWWAYKFEVYDAIPYAGALMHNAGVVVSFNSDDRELARHLNHEAAKAVKYGGVPPEEALKFVTLNPAKQLRIDQYVGSIEPGKHADIVLWSGDPLSTLSRCEKTWVDGRRMFDREQDQEKRSEFETMKQTLIQKVLSSGEKPNDLPGGRVGKPSEMWPNYDEFCRCKGSR